MIDASVVGRARSINRGRGEPGPYRDFLSCRDFVATNSEEIMKVEGEHTQTAKIDVASRKTVRSAFWTGILLGVGIMAFLDETLLHQLLQWHTFYWNTDQHGRILSDGLFHAFSTLLLLWGALRLWRGRDTWISPFRELIVAAIIIGAGGFNLYDGIIQHAILHLHQVNELVCLTPASRSDTILGFCRNDIPYEIVFDLLALVVLIIGILYWRHQVGTRFDRVRDSSVGAFPTRNDR